MYVSFTHTFAPAGSRTVRYVGIVPSYGSGFGSSSGSLDPATLLSNPLVLSVAQAGAQHYY